MKRSVAVLAASLIALGSGAVHAQSPDEYVFCATVIDDDDYSVPSPVYISRIFRADYANMGPEERSLHRNIMRRDGHELYRMQSFCFFGYTREEAEDRREDNRRDYEDNDNYRVMRWEPGP